MLKKIKIGKTIKKRKKNNNNQTLPVMGTPIDIGEDPIGFPNGISAQHTGNKQVIIVSHPKRIVLRKRTATHVLLVSQH